MIRSRFSRHPPLFAFTRRGQHYELRRGRRQPLFPPHPLRFGVYLLFRARRTVGSRRLRIERSEGAHRSLFAR